MGPEKFNHNGSANRMFSTNNKPTRLQYALMLARTEKEMEKKDKEIRRLRREVGILKRRIKNEQKKEKKSQLRVEAPEFEPVSLPPPPPPLPSEKQEVSALPTSSPSPSPSLLQPPLSLSPSSTTTETTTLSAPISSAEDSENECIFNYNYLWQIWHRLEEGETDKLYCKGGLLIENPGEIKTTWMENKDGHRFWLIKGGGMEEERGTISIMRTCIMRCVCTEDFCVMAEGKRRRILEKAVFTPDKMGFPAPPDSDTEMDTDKGEDQTDPMDTDEEDIGEKFREKWKSMWEEDRPEEDTDGGRDVGGYSCFQVFIK